MPKTAPIRFRVSVEQKAAVERIAAERDVPIAALFRDLITTTTGVPDPLRRHGKRGAGRPPKT
jgi:hypothetical protein